MSTSDANTQQQPDVSRDSDDSSTSQTIFNRSTFDKILLQQIPQQANPILSEAPSTTNILDGEHTTAAPSTSRLYVSQDQFVLQTKALHQQQYELNSLKTAVFAMHDQIARIATALTDTSCSPPLPSRPISVHSDMNQYVSHEKVNLNNWIPPSDLQDHPTDSQQVHSLQTMLHNIHNTLQHREAEIENLKQQLRDAPHSQSQPVNNSSAVPPSSAHVLPPLSPTPPASAFVPIPAPAHTSSHNSTTNDHPSQSQFPFTTSLPHSFPKFSGKDCEMPTKFITEFEFSATRLFGFNDDYLLRTIDRCLFDNALTWYIQINQEQSITLWSQFKDLFLQRFRTPVKIEFLRGRLRSLWQADNEPIVDYYERLKSLLSEIDPQTSPDYLKRKFVQKLRNDIRSKITLGQSSSLSALLQHAIEIESNILQQNLDQKLRATHITDNTNTSTSTSVNNLSCSSTLGSSLSTSNNKPITSDHPDSSAQHRSNPNGSAGNKHSRTSTNSPTSFQPTYIQHESQNFRQHHDHNPQTIFTNDHRWCSPCYSSGYDWSHCYCNPDSCYYHSAWNQYDSQQYYRQQPQQQYHHQQPQQQYYRQQSQPQQHYRQSSQPQHHYHQQSLGQHPQPTSQQRQQRYRHQQSTQPHQQHSQQPPAAYPIPQRPSSSKNI